MSRTPAQKLNRRQAYPVTHTIPEGDWKQHSPEKVREYIQAFWCANYGRHPVTYLVAGQAVVA